MIKTFFFDRDGVLIKNYGYVSNVQRIKWLKGAISAIKFLNKENIKVIVITNQSGVARGYFKEKDVKMFHNYMNEQLISKKAFINDFFYW